MTLQESRTNLWLIMTLDAEAVGRGAAVLSAVEIGLGSALHALRVPLSGYFLSLNQVFLLARNVKRHPELPLSTPFQVSAIASLLKSLSPAGKKLTPMLAISCQGLLFNGGTFLVGRNFLGVVLGGILSSVWSFLQPLMLYYLLYGETLIKVANYFYRQLSAVVSFAPEALWGVAVGAVLLKATLAAFLGGLAWHLPESRFSQYEKKLFGMGQARRNRAVSFSHENQTWKCRAKFALKELMSPLFLISLLLTVVFFFFAESRFSSILWGCLRPVATGFLVFLCVRSFPAETLARWLDGGPLRGFSQAFKVAVRRLREPA